MRISIKDIIARSESRADALCTLAKERQCTFKEASILYSLLK